MILQKIKESLSGLYHWKNSSSGSSIINFIKSNPFTLKFESNIEESFLQQYYIDSVKHLNFWIPLSGLLFLVFFLLDSYLIPKITYSFLLIGILVLCCFSICLIIINRVRDKKITQVISVVITSVLIFGMMSFQIIARPTHDNIYYTSIVIASFWSYSFFRLKFFSAIFTALFTSSLYFFFAHYLIDVKQETFAFLFTAIISTNFVGVIVSYVNEYFARERFIKNLQLADTANKNIGLSNKIKNSIREKISFEEKLILNNKALDVAANSILLTTKDGKIIYCNRAMENLSGYKEEELIGKNPRIFKSGKYSHAFYKHLWETVLDGRIWSGELINKKKNGDLYFEDLTITPVKNSNQIITHFIAIKQDITLRKSMEKEIYENERRLRHLFDNATMGIYQTNRSGEIIYANNAIIKMLGYDSLEDIRNRKFNKEIYKNLDKRKEFIKIIETKGKINDFESEWIKKDGTIIFVRENAQLDFDENGSAIYEGMVEDITSKKLVEKELVENKKRIQAVFDNLNDAIFLHDKSGKIINVNKKTLELYQLTMEEALLCSVDNLSSKDNSFDQIKEKWIQVIEENKTFSFEWKAKRPKDNYIFDVHVVLSRIIIDNKPYIIANVRDISGHKKVKKQLLIMQKAIDLNASPILWLNNSGKIIYANQVVEKYIEYSPSEINDMSVSKFDSFWNEDYWNNFSSSELRKNGKQVIKSTYTSKSGRTFPVEVNASIIKIDSEEIIVAIVTDITSREQAAKAIMAAKENAEKANKLKSEFLAGMSHEIRTPINTILNFTSLIKNDLGDDISDDIKESFSMIDSGSQRLIRTIDSILNMSQLQSGSYDLNLQEFDIINDVLSVVMGELKTAAKNKNLQFDLIVNTAETMIYADKYTVSQLFVNLIDNAIKYTRKGFVNVRVSSNDIYVITEVIDSGIGISKEFLPKLFDPFLQEEMGYSRSFEGTGLGLSLVKNYVELNSGKIEVKSEKGVGSTFIIKLNKPY